MAVNLLVALAVFAVYVVSLNLEPAEFMEPYTDDSARWPYGGCVEVTKIYPAPGSHLPPPLNKHAKEWNLTITVVFSRPVTMIRPTYFDFDAWYRFSREYRDPKNRDDRWRGKIPELLVT